MYQPRPIKHNNIELPSKSDSLIEQLAENNYDIWAKQRIQDGWTYGPERDDNKKEHPDLVPYGELSENEKEYDRNSARETIKAVISFGFNVVKER